MLFFRWIVLLLLASGAVCFAIYVVTGSAGWRDRGLRVVKWTVFAALAFFAVLVLEQMTAAL